MRIDRADAASTASSAHRFAWMSERTATRIAGQPSALRSGPALAGRLGRAGSAGGIAARLVDDDEAVVVEPRAR